MEKQQISQEEEYFFPYHYIPHFYKANKISLIRYWGWGLEYMGRISLIQDILDSLKFNSLLDIGCGDGALISLLASKYQECDFYGIDYSSHAIKLAQALNSHLKNLNYLTLDINHDNVSNGIKNNFDIVTMIEVIEHIPPDMLQNFLSASLSFLKEEGTLILTVPSKNLPIPPKHYQHFDINTLTILLESAQLTIEHYEYIDESNGLLIKLLKKFLHNSIYNLNHSYTINIIFEYYKKYKLRNRDSQNGQGILIVCKKQN